jgi:excisionase family DNA binding protein
MQSPPMTREEIAEYLKVSTMTISRYISQGMPHLRAPEGGRVLFDPDDVVAWLKSHGSTPAEVPAP